MSSYNKGDRGGVMRLDRELDALELAFIKSKGAVSPLVKELMGQTETFPDLAKYIQYIRTTNTWNFVRKIRKLHSCPEETIADLIYKLLESKEFTIPIIGMISDLMDLLVKKDWEVDITEWISILCFRDSDPLVELFINFHIKNPKVLLIDITRFLLLIDKPGKEYYTLPMLAFTCADKLIYELFIEKNIIDDSWISKVPVLERNVEFIDLALQRALCNSNKAFIIKIIGLWDKFRDVSHTERWLNKPNINKFISEYTHLGQLFLSYNDYLEIDEQIEIAEILVALGAKVDAHVGGDQMSLLYHVCDSPILMSEDPDMKIIKWVLSHKPKPNGCTDQHPFHGALEHGSIELLQMLLTYGTTFDGFNEEIAFKEAFSGTEKFLVRKSLSFLMHARYSKFVEAFSGIPDESHGPTYCMNLIAEGLKKAPSTENTWKNIYLIHLELGGYKRLIDKLMVKEPELVIIILVWAGQNGYRDIVMYITEHFEKVLKDGFCASVVIEYAIETKNSSLYYPFNKYPLATQTLEKIRAGCKDSYLFYESRHENGLWKSMSEEERAYLGNDIDWVSENACEGMRAQGKQYYDGC
jgi:hypothetical protein